MSNNTEEQITHNVLTSMEQAPNPRLKAVMNSLITHLHAFIRETELTQEEWAAGIQFLTRTGQMCDDKRQEFILLSDITGVTMLVDAINHRMPDGATESTIFGPFYREGAPELPMGATISQDHRGGPVVQLLRALGRHPFRPAHIHLLISAEGFVPVTTHLFVKGDPYLDSDAVFGTKDSLVVDFIRHESAEEAAQYHVSIPFYTVTYDFILKPR